MFDNDTIFSKVPDSAGPTPSHRRQILQKLLENKEGVPIDEVSKILNISRTAVQNHFLMLEKEGLIKKNNQLKTLGRPSATYVLTDKGIACFPKNYAQFSVLLLDDLKKKRGADWLRDAMHQLGKQIAGEYYSRFEGLKEEHKLAALLILLQDLGFYADYSQDFETQAVEINIHNCIFHDIAQKIDEICALDRALFSELMNHRIELRCSMAKGDKMCCFKLHSNCTQKDS